MYRATELTQFNCLEKRFVLPSKNKTLFFKIQLIFNNKDILFYNDGFNFGARNSPNEEQ